MKHYKRLFSVYRTIKRSRFRKKWDTYKTIYSMSMDRTILLYTLAVLGYMSAGLIISGDFSYDIRPYFSFVEEIGRENLLFVASLYSMRYVFQSLRRPGVIFSSTEYQLSMLPYTLRSIWNVVVFDKWMKRIAFGLIAWLLLTLTPLSGAFVGMYVFLFVIVDLLMTAPLWRLYQQRFIVKLLSLLGLGAIIGALVMIDPMIGAVTACTGLIVWNLYAWRHVMRRVQWGKITALSDFHIWNIPFVSHITKVPFKREKRIYVLQHIPYRRKRLSYKASTIHHRLWHAYMIKSTRTIFQLLGSLLVFLTVLAFIREFIFYIGIAATIYMYTTTSASIFYDRFRSDILQALPWNVSVFRQTFMRWNIYGGMIISIPVIGYFVYHFTWWVPVQGFLCVTVFLYMLHNEVDRSAVLLAKETKKFTILDILGAIGLIAIVLSATYPFISLISFGYLYLFIHLRRQSLEERNKRSPHIVI